MYKCKVNGKATELAKGKLLPALRQAGFKVPSVCWHADIDNSGGRCRVCVCSVDGRVGTPCNIPVKEGMDIVTDSPELTDDRAAAFALIPHSKGKYEGPAQYTEELVARTGSYARLPGESERKEKSYEGLPIDFSAQEKDKAAPGTVKIPGMRQSYVIAHPDKCVHCGLCVKMCQEVQGLGAIADMRKPELTSSNVDKGGVHAFSDQSLFLSECVSCGQCINVCPYGALEEYPELAEVEALLKDDSVVKVVQFAPAVRVAIAEEFGCAPGTKIATKEMVGAIKQIATNSFIYDTNFTADLTIVEEGAELLERLRRTLTGTRKFQADNDDMPISLPMITSCSPGWVLFAEKNYPDLLEHLSTCKSPQQMHGAMTKHYWAEKNGHDPKKIKAISIMPCVAKKAEKDRPEFATDGVPDVDHVITTREFARLLKKNNINLLDAPKEDFDHAFGFGSSAGMIFGATGGVMEAALRTAYNLVTDRDVPFQNLEILPVRGMEGVRMKTIEFRDVLPAWSFLEGVDLKIAVAHGIANARKLMDRLRERKEEGLPPEFHFIEVMCCPGGCLGGGGQPKPTNMEIKKLRGKLIYAEAASLPTHRSHDNPRIKEVYGDFLGEIGGHRAHKLLHTHYTARHAASDALLDSPDADATRKVIERENFSRTRSRITNLFSAVVDELGCISDPSVAVIAKHARTTPVDVDSVLSHYHFFPRHTMPPSMVYLCECPTCRLKGTKPVKQWFKKADIPYHVVSWLGWCVNSTAGPGCLVKHIGDPQVHALLGVQPDDPRLFALPEVKNPFPELTYDVRSIHRRDGCANAVSLLAPVTLKDIMAQSVRVATAARDKAPETIVAMLKASGLRGCGGAGFPTHIKWNAVSKEPSPPEGKNIVINADEGLPSTFKDYHLMQSAEGRIRMMGGICAAAHTTGAKRCLLYLRYEYKNLFPLLMASWEAFKAEAGDVVPEDFVFEIVLGGGPYVCGEETALFESVEGHLPQARVVRSIFPTQHGLFGKPTLVSNVETISWVNEIIDKGPEAFNVVRTASDQLGPKLLSISGGANPVLAEFPMGSTVGSIVEETAGFPMSEVAAAEVGGILEPLLFPSNFGRIASLDNRGNHVSAGGSVVIYNTNRFSNRNIFVAKAKFCNLESCQLCVPCREGTSAMRACVDSLFNGSMLEDASAPQLKRLSELATAMEHSSNCGHGKAAGKLSHLVIDQLKNEHDHHGSFC